MAALPNDDSVGGGAHSVPAGGSTAVRMLLGARLRRLREAGGISRRDAGQVIRASESKLSRLELGRVGFKERDIVDLLALYGMTDEQELAICLSMAERANGHDWWHRYLDVLPNWFHAYIGLEHAASAIRTYEMQFVPGLFQTEDYARAVIRLGAPGAPGPEVERRVEVRMRRQRLLGAAHPPRLWAVIDETMLRRPMVSRQVMWHQVQRLIELTGQPGISIQILPLRRGGQVAAGVPFSILRFDEPELPDVVFLEQLSSGRYLDRRDDIDLYRSVMDSLLVVADDPATTARTLSRIAGEL